MHPNTAEHARLAQVRNDITGWRRWGPYVGDRAWATVREDYSPEGNPWRFFPHDLAKSRAYRWGEDGIAGICDRYQLICFAPAFWNGADPILKERLYGVGQLEGNHGEDVKEYYFYLDNVPSHAYMKFLYKYPQSAFPYAELAETNRGRNGQGFEYELIDTGIFDDDRYFDIVVEYAKETEEDIAVRIEAFNRGPEPAGLRLLPHLWFRNTWSWGSEPRETPRIRVAAEGAGGITLLTDDAGVGTISHVPIAYRVGRRVLHAPPGGTPLFTENETNAGPGGPRFVKDAFHRHIIGGEDCVNPSNFGSKAALHYRFDAVPPGGSVVLRLRLAAADPPKAGRPPKGGAGPGAEWDDFIAGDVWLAAMLDAFPEREIARDLKIPPAAQALGEVDAIVARRRAEADEFYAAIHRPGASEDERRVQRQAFAGLLWSKSFYFFDVHTWLEGDDPSRPPPESRKAIRNAHWRHLKSMRVMTLPDKWEYPWFAAWDLAFQAVAFAVIDPKFAMDQLWMLLFEQFQHPNGQIPAFEWEFSDLNPPVHAWAVWRVYNMARIRTGYRDRAFLERCFHKLMMNFTWWVNRVDAEGNNIFEGGFMGMDNVSPVDRGGACAGGAVLEQSDATGWMGMFCLNMMRIALELAKENPVYEGLATKFLQHYAYIAAAMKHAGGREHQLWDERDGFFYDLLNYPDGRAVHFRIRSMVGLVPLFAVERLERDWIAPFREFTACLDWFLELRKDLVRDVVHTVERGGKTTHVLTILNQEQLGRIARRMYDPEEFLSDYGIRSLSKAHRREPFRFNGQEVRYEPAETATKIMGGNSNWRGPIWFPMNFLLIESLRKLATAFGPDFAVTTPGSGERPITFPEMARSIADRLIRIFVRGADGNRPVYGGTRKFQEDPHWRDLLLYYEYFHGDEGAGLGAAHQTGWTALVGSLIDEWRGA